ncbi:hypothetical protein [Edaphobacter sp. 12200R-103]|jgi:hypothetical protein|uniref:hypothetical protein n=1 Tax=Edaphobacter sp. 12200R-103 TaxID=2703788 RepID=UPI00138C663C|nr:hypothetical protein [Edaphobacter sp. 12200R-103]QHS53346.1 hypothetical protein GWR55_17740 [Edaphobacter sp. 12200R-103]
MGIGAGFARLLLYALLGWTALGAIGVTISFRRGERFQGRKNLGWIAAIWIIYIGILLSVSLTAKPRVVLPGRDYCFDSLCFSVVRTETVPGYLGNRGERIVKVYVRITNHSDKRNSSDAHLKLYMVDARGRRWDEASGLEGVRLSTPVGPRQTVLTTPVFKVGPSAEGLRLVLTHDHNLPYLLLLGDTGSIFHGPAYLSLDQ